MVPMIYLKVSILDRPVSFLKFLSTFLYDAWHMQHLLESLYLESLNRTPSPLSALQNLLSFSPLLEIHILGALEANPLSGSSRTDEGATPSNS
jgi:hypothetical protein